MKKNTKNILIILISLFFIIPCTARNYSTHKKKAIRFYEQAEKSQNYYKKESLYKQAIKKDRHFTEAYWKLSQLYAHYKKYSLSKSVLRKALMNKAPLKNKTYIRLAKYEYIDGRYKQALEAYGKIDTLTLSTKELHDFHTQQTNVKEALKIINSPFDYKPVNLKNVNTSYDDYFPSITADEKMLCTTVNDRVYHKTEGEDIYRSYYKNGKWHYSRPFAYPINTAENEGSQSFSADGRYLFFVRCNAADSYGSCDIYYAQNFGTSWAELRHFKEPINSRYWDSTPVMSPTGNKIYFASNRPGGLGGSDIWEADIEIQEDGSLISSNVRNLGTPINTPLDEHSPFIHTDNTTLYFSSNGHRGLGKMDIYKVVKEDGKWKNVMNMGYPLNSSGDEFGFAVNAKGNIAYFASDQLENTKRGMEIYQISLPKEQQPNSMRSLHGYITNAETGKAIQTKVEIYNQKGNISYSESISDRNSGNFTVFLPDSGQYGLSVNNLKYLFYSANINHQQDSMLIQLTPIAENTCFQLNNLFFATDKEDILPSSQGEINRLSKFIINNKSWNFCIEGHTDNVGNNKYNKELSLKRAQAVKRALTKIGINAEKLKVKGLGSSQPIEDNATKEGRSKNRRVVIRIIK